MGRPLFRPYRRICARVQGDQQSTEVDRERKLDNMREAETTDYAENGPKQGGNEQTCAILNSAVAFPAAAASR